MSVTADDWSLLVSMGWRMVAGDEVRCVLCVKRERPERRRPPARVLPIAPARERRELS